MKIIFKNKFKTEIEWKKIQTEKQQISYNFKKKWLHESSFHVCNKMLNLCNLDTTPVKSSFSVSADTCFKTLPGFAS